MNRTQLIAAVAERAGISKSESGKMINAVLGVISDNLTEGDGDLMIPDFGHFSLRTVPAHEGFNPATKEKILIEERTKVVFKASENIEYYSRKHT